MLGTADGHGCAVYHVSTVAHLYSVLTKFIVLLQLCFVRRHRFFFGYLHLLVSLGIFDVIEMHFGLKGHTHDGWFQRPLRPQVASDLNHMPTR